MQERRGAQAMIKVGIAGATGYVGIELVRILAHHKEVELVYAATRSHEGQCLSKVYPHLRGVTQIECSALEPVEMAAKCDLIFIALPHGEAQQIAPALLDAGKRVIDLGADFRLKEAASYKKWYGREAAAPGCLKPAVYGLPEVVAREKIRQADLVACPGCYPTACALAAMPALRCGIAEREGIIFDAKSGLSGAGRALSLTSHFCEVAENVSAYSIGGSHRHTPEIEEVLGEVAGGALTVQFTPHLVPAVRGLLVTAYLQLKRGLTQEVVWEIYREAYMDEPFIRLCALGELPQTANVRGSNYCDIGLQVDERTGRLIVVSVIDNLIKGAAGQAVQNMNLIFDLPETTGLGLVCPAYP